MHGPMMSMGLLIFCNAHFTRNYTSRCTISRGYTLKIDKLGNPINGGPGDWERQLIRLEIRHPRHLELSDWTSLAFNQRLCVMRATDVNDASMRLLISQKKTWDIW